MKNKDTDFYHDYVTTSNEYKHFEFLQWFINTIVDDVYCDLINNLKGEIEILAEFALNNYLDYKEYHPLDIWQAYCKNNHSSRKVDDKLKSAILSKHNYQCTVCGSTENLQIDHIFPYSKGGKTVYNNLTVLCQICNLKKSDKY